MIIIKNNTTRGNIARVIFYLLIGISIIMLYSNYLQYQLLNGLKNGASITAEMADSNNLRQRIISLLNVPLLLASSIFFLIWIYRAYDNLYKLRENNMDCTPGWAIGYWFVPVMSLFKPFTVMKEIWDKTQSFALPEEEKGDIVKSYLVGFWWTFYLTSIFSSYFSVLFFRDTISTDSKIDLTLALMVSNTFLITAKIIALVMINKIVIYENNLWEFVNSKDNNPFGENIPHEASMNIPSI
jgi:hypothetical protein